MSTKHPTVESCERCGSTTDTKRIQIDKAWIRICFNCYMKDDSKSYGFQIPGR